MFYKKLLNGSPARDIPQPEGSSLHLVSDSDVESGARTEFSSASRFEQLGLITARRCSGFFAEAAVLVLVFGILDLLIVKGHVAGVWIASALALSGGLLGLSIVTEFGAHRWIKAHP